MKDSIFKRHLLAIYYKFSDSKQLHYIRKCYKLNIMSSVQTIAYIKEHHCSISRFGDGEFSIMLNKGEPTFQRRSDAMAEALLNVFADRSDNLLICLPYPLVCDRGMKKAKRFWRSWAISFQPSVVRAINGVSSQEQLFGDACISRPYTGYRSSKKAKKIFGLLKDIWDAQDILIVEGEQSRLGVDNDLFSNAHSIKRILAPAENAFDCYSDILTAVCSIWHGELVIIALGPTATVLASDLSKREIQALDLGHIDIQYEWYLKGDSSFQPVPGKYTNEAIGGQDAGTCEDADYLSQIVATIQ